MLGALGGIVGGLIFLVVGGEALLRGAVGLARLWRLTPAVIGLTVVAAGTSVPELAVSVIASWQGKTDIAVGNVVGSNIFNIAVILGVVALYNELTLSGNSIKLEYPVLLLVTLLLLVLGGDGTIDRVDALLFLLIYVAFTAYLVRLVCEVTMSNFSLLCLVCLRKALLSSIPLWMIRCCSATVHLG